jgi:cell wall-associated NlpC family hydrolase
MPVKPGYLFLAGGGGVLVWSGLKGKSVSSVFRQLAGGDSPANAVTAQPIAGVTPSSGTGIAAAAAVPAGTSGLSSKAAIMLNYCNGEVGKPYSEDTSVDPSTGEEYRFGPSEYDCSGLIYSAAHAAGINIPASMALANLEAVYFAGMSGSKKILSQSAVQEGDICFFTGSDPGPSPGNEFPPIGHVGMCSAPGELVSAYDTQLGVCQVPLSQGGGFIVAVRLAG